MKGLAGKRMVITGGCGGIGRAVAARFVREGARVVITDVLPEKDGANGEAELQRRRAFAPTTWIALRHCAEITNRMGNAGEVLRQAIG